ncbi:hypothetical protein IEO21_06315 [Rhodonia placenta]|uniref:Uncharacterized protein n=1 Tax=Rhodonia placenta TaxID=104341 RepID=A0A8H7U1G1_9APHY|nr:hypothetical protein IEO21_06315 [Postia placenta]
MIAPAATTGRPGPMSSVTSARPSTCPPYWGPPRASPRWRCSSRAVVPSRRRGLLGPPALARGAGRRSVLLLSMTSPGMRLPCWARWRPPMLKTLKTTHRELRPLHGGASLGPSRPPPSSSSPTTSACTGGAVPPVALGRR